MDRYPMQAYALGEEIAESLPEEDVERLRSALAGRGSFEWLMWCRDNRQALAKYLSSTPAQRRQRKAYRGQQHLFAYGAFLLSRHAHALLEAARSPELSPGRSYRQTTADAALLYDEVLEPWLQPPEWPKQWGEPPAWRGT